MRGASGNPIDGVRIRGLLLSVLGVGTLLIAPGVAGPGAPATAAAVRTSSDLPDTGPPAFQLGGGFSANGGNWSGYVATGTGLRSVSARWAEPAVTCTSTAETFSPWVGIDGYGSSTVQQAGVATDCSSGKPVYRAWYETAPEPPVYYPLAVHAGDEIKAEVARSGSTYTMRISDVTRNWTRSAIKSFPGANVSAEVVLEALAGRFPTFEEVAFTNATVDGKPLGSAKPIAIDATDATGFLTATSSLSGAVSPSALSANRASAGARTHPARGQPGRTAIYRPAAAERGVDRRATPAAAPPAHAAVVAARCRSAAAGCVGVRAARAMVSVDRQGRVDAPWHQTWRETPRPGCKSAAGVRGSGHCPRR